MLTTPRTMIFRLCNYRYKIRSGSYYGLQNLCTLYIYIYSSAFGLVWHSWIIHENCQACMKIHTFGNLSYSLKLITSYMLVMNIFWIATIFNIILRYSQNTLLYKHNIVYASQAPATNTHLSNSFFPSKLNSIAW